MKRVTLKKVAEMARVGSATAERVLNGRGGVGPELVERVLKAARKLDYPKRLPEQHRGFTRIEVLMTRPDLSFLARLSKSFARIASSLDPSISVQRTFIKDSNPEVVAAHILATNVRRSALIVMLPEHPLISNALQQAAASGTAVVQMVSKFDGLDAPYAGIDNAAAGRMAGLLMTGMQRNTGTVVALCHSQQYGVHRGRISGFSEYMARKEADHLLFRQVAFTFDDAEEAARTAAHLMRSIPDLVGIYSTGGDYGPLCSMLQRSHHNQKICLIGHELTAVTETALKDGIMDAVIDQAPETQARRALDTVLFKLGMIETPVDTAPIRFITITAENV